MDAAVSKVMKAVGLLLCLISLFILSACVSTSGTATETHQKGMSSVTENEYVVPKKPIDRHYIGSAWSKQFGPVEDPLTEEIRVKKERSLNTVQQDFAFKAGLAIGGQSIVGPMGEAGIQGGSIEKAKLEGVEIISPVSLADIPFEPGIPYITEALRLKGFRIKEEAQNQASIGVSASAARVGSGTAVAEVGTQARRATEGEGLVVAYKLHTINMGTYTKKDSGILPLPLDKNVDLTNASMVVKARLQHIEPGAGKSLPRNVIWSCPVANAKSKDAVAAWVVDLRSLDPKRKSLSIAFPAHPRIDECQTFSSVIFSRIDPTTDKIIRQKVTINVLEDELNERLQPKKWDARISLVDESFNIKLVKPEEVQ